MFFDLINFIASDLSSANRLLFIAIKIINIVKIEMYSHFITIQKIEILLVKFKF